MGQGTRARDEQDAERLIATSVGMLRGFDYCRFGRQACGQLLSKRHGRKLGVVDYPSARMDS